MALIIYYMMVPTAALIEAARAGGEEWLLEPDVWIDVEHPRVGREHPQEQVERAAWTLFLAKLAWYGVESDAHRRFRELCLQLGFKGCWSVHVAKAGDRVEDLLAEAADNESLARIAMGLDPALPDPQGGEHVGG